MPADVVFHTRFTMGFRCGEIRMRQAAEMIRSGFYLVNKTNKIIYIHNYV